MVFRIFDISIRIWILGSVHWITDPDPVFFSKVYLLISNCRYGTITSVLYQSSKIARYLEVTKWMKTFRIFDISIRIWILGSVHWIRRIRILCFFLSFFCLGTVGTYDTITSVLYQSSKIASHIEVTKLIKVFRIFDVLIRIWILGSAQWITDPDLVFFFLKFFFCLVLTVDVDIFTSVFKDSIARHLEGAGSAENNFCRWLGQCDHEFPIFPSWKATIPDRLLRCKKDIIPVNYNVQ
jgi:hypothetical protein